MDEKVVLRPDEAMSFWDSHRFALLLIFTILIALTMTVISMIAYNSSGTAQLDLSRPGYRSVSDQVDRDTQIDEYGANGEVNKGTIDEFMELYDTQAAKAKGVDAFNGDPLNPEILEFGTASAE